MILEYAANIQHGEAGKNGIDRLPVESRALMAQCTRLFPHNERKRQVAPITNTVRTRSLRALEGGTV